MTGDESQSHICILYLIRLTSQESRALFVSFIYNFHLHASVLDRGVETRSNGTRKRRTADFYVTGNQSPYQLKTRECRANERSGRREEYGQHVPSYDVSG